ncbi:phasin family protein [Vreelandella populi]|uniref:Phasin family protein n=1 Tax=Vreelandella populi TaxID=2498858 RepID=A0A3S0WPS4_9GAMM|nr:phasin family protein [Halomonas populi]RUR37735.1 phasin family protein [Halomonas populi]RUR48644.1 phasin family protein [Halomonas populi]RUR55042.1 phasin family protein [Halomonas populi]
MMKSTENSTQQFESTFVSPMRSYTQTALDYYQKLMGAQLDAARAYSDMTVSQARTWLDVKDADSFKKAMESQQRVASDFMERLKGDSEKVTSIGQGFMQESQKMTEENTQKAADNTQKAADNIQQKASDNIQKSADAAKR